MNITIQSAADRKAMSFAMNLSLGVGLLMFVMKMGAYLLTGSSAILSDADMAYLLKVARALGLTVLVEVHDAAELERVLALDGVQLIGINNRDLATFHTDLATTEALPEQVQAGREASTLATIEDPAALAIIYQQHGASAISVLTEQRKFKGSLEDLERQVEDAWHWAQQLPAAAPDAGSI